MLEKQELNLLEIKVKDINSAPQVFYKGEEIDGLIGINYDWKTGTSEILFEEHVITIKAYGSDGNDGMIPSVDTIRRELLR